jgi:hypothetical protein
VKQKTLARRTLATASPTKRTTLTFKGRPHVQSYRSNLETGTAAWLAEQGVDAAYEDPSSVIRYTKPESKHRYTPDFVLPNGIIIETKGQFVSKDRGKHLLIREQHPHLDIRFVFSNPNARIGKSSKTTYADWCNGKNPDKAVFLFAKAPTKAQARDGAPWIPLEWIEEPHRGT